MFLRLLPPMLCALPLPAMAQDVPCDLYSGAEACVPVLACVGDKGLWFDGRAYGSGPGRIEGVLSDGITCTGTWKARNIFGLGQSDLYCGDRRQARIFYTDRDGSTGTATGGGRSSRGEVIKAWAGDAIGTYLARKNGQESLPCAGGDIPLG